MDSKKDKRRKRYDLISVFLLFWALGVCAPLLLTKTVTGPATLLLMAPMIPGIVMILRIIDEVIAEMMPSGTMPLSQDSCAVPVGRWTNRKKLHAEMERKGWELIAVGQHDLYYGKKPVPEGDADATPV